MKFYCAPMEGVSIALYRNLHKELFEGVDKYFTPFVVPSEGMKANTRQIKDVLPENNKDLPIIPQIMTNNAKDFLKVSEDFKEWGYEEVNLNLGCPSGTVVSKKRGSGFLAYPEELERFLYEIFEKANVRISVKTRLGVEDPVEFYRIFEILNQFDMEELIIHPRVTKDRYKLRPNQRILEEVIIESRNSCCYNGDVFAPSDLNFIRQKYPGIDSVMLGRGVIANPALIRELKGGAPLTKEELRKLHDNILEEYKERLSGDTHVLNRMKEYWYYMNHSFKGDKSKIVKRIRKSQKLDGYHEAVECLFDGYEVGAYFWPY